MPTCFTVSLSPSPTHLFKFQVRFQVANRDSAPSHEQTRGCEYNVVHGKDIAAIDSSLCQCWSSAGRARSPPCSHPRLMSPSVSALVEAGRGLRKEFGFLGPLSICPTKSAISRLVVGAEWRKRRMISAGAGGALVVHPHSPRVCPCVRGEGWFSWPHLSARVIVL